MTVEAFMNSSPPKEGARPMRPLRALLALSCIALASCQSFKVDLQSPEPIKVDVNMRLDVYQYKGDEPDKPDAAQASYDAAQTRLRNRYAEIQTFKNNGLVGEDHRGLLHLREKPAGEWGDYVEKQVNQENEDRTILIRRLAKDSDRAMHEVQDEQWKQRTSKAYHGEWIEVPGDKQNTFKWVQSNGPRQKPASNTAGDNSKPPGTVTPAPGT
jgi:uncharacterized protein YdbL (DUF1318 family)